MKIIVIAEAEEAQNFQRNLLELIEQSKTCPFNHCVSIECDINKRCVDCLINHIEVISYGY